MSCHVSKRFPCTARHCSFNRNNYPTSDNAGNGSVLRANETKVVVVHGKNNDRSYQRFNKAVINRDYAPSNSRFESAIERHRLKFTDFRKTKVESIYIILYNYHPCFRHPPIIRRTTHSNECSPSRKDEPACKYDNWI